MSSVFISYRREDTAGHAGRLYDRLVQRFGEDRIFMDLQIEPGDDFVERIEQGVGSCEVLLVLVGRRWLTADDPEGKRRLDDPNDFARIELAAALERGVRVIPVLIGGARMPQSGDLPPALAKFARRQALDLSDVGFSADFERLVSTIERELAHAEKDLGVSSVASRSVADQPRSKVEGSPVTPAATPAEYPIHTPPTQVSAPKGGEGVDDSRRDQLPRLPQQVASVSGVALVVATFLAPIENADLKLGDSGASWLYVPAVLLGITLASTGIFQQSRFDKTPARLATFILSLLGGAFALSLVIYVGWIYVLDPAASIWLILGFVMLLAGSTGIARLWVAGPVDKLDVPILIGALAGVALALTAFTPLGKYSEPLLASGDGTFVDGLLALAFGLTIAWGGLGPQHSFLSQRPHPWLIGPLLAAAAFSWVVARELFLGDAETSGSFWIGLGILLIGTAVICVVRVWRGLGSASWGQDIG